MPLRVISFETTPNPNAKKCVLDGRISDRPRSFRSSDDAMGDPTAAALFAIPGVTGVLMNGDWVTVNKAAEAAWGEVERGVRETLSRAGDPA
jgi:hypothetical protein